MAAFKDDQCMQRVGKESHLSRLSSGLNQLRQQASFCDVSIIVGDQRFPAHKAVLSSTSDYFQGMFSSGFQESTMSEVTVPGTKESFAQILDFAYTGYFTLSLRTVIDILKMACYMVLTEAMKLCEEYLREVNDKFTIEDCFEIWGITSSHNCLSDTAQLYRNHLMKSFSSCVESQSFLEKSSASVMIEFLSDEEIESDDITEEQILQAALIWLKFDWEQRKVHAFDLLKKIRLGLVPLDRLGEILGDELLSIPECKDIVEEVIKLSATKDRASPPLIKSHPGLFASRNTIMARLTNDRLELNKAGSLPIVSLKCETSTACYKITNLADVPNQYSYSHRDELHIVSSCVSIKNQLYVAIYIEYSGQDDEDSENHEKWLSKNNFFQYIPEKNEWSVLTPMPQVVEYPRLFQLEDYIYVIGEYDVQCCIQRYSILGKSWEILKDNTWFNTFDAIIVPMGQILIKGSQLRDGDDDFSVVAALYKPATNELLDVSIDGTLDLDSFLVEHENKCFELIREYDHEDQVNRLICDFDSDKPTMKIAEATADETHAVVDMHFSPEFTFDKRKLGLVQVPCECKSHVKKE